MNIAPHRIANREHGGRGGRGGRGVVAYKEHVHVNVHNDTVKLPLPFQRSDLGVNQLLQCCVLVGLKLGRCFQLLQLDFNLLRPGFGFLVFLQLIVEECLGWLVGWLVDCLFGCQDSKAINNTLGVSKDDVIEDFAGWERQHTGGMRRI